MLPMEILTKETQVEVSRQFDIAEVFEGHNQQLMKSRLFIETR